MITLARIRSISTWSYYLSSGVANEDVWQFQALGEFSTTSTSNKDRFDFCPIVPHSWMSMIQRIGNTSYLWEIYLLTDWCRERTGWAILVDSSYVHVYVLLPWEMCHTHECSMHIVRVVQYMDMVHHKHRLIHTIQTLKSRPLHWA